MRVLTLTANLLAETTFAFDAWREGATQRARAESFQVGGKGINVTKMLMRLGVASEALCFPGGTTGARCENWLKASAIPFRAFRTSLETRTGTVVRLPGRPETTFLGADSVIDPEAVGACTRALESEPRDTVLAICGSIPGWDAPLWNPLRAACEAWVANGRRLIADTYGPPLPWFARSGCDLVKINRVEFAGLVGAAPGSIDDDAMPRWLAEASGRFACTNWIITDGPRRVWFCELGAPPDSVLPPVIEEVSPTGSGDVFLAGVVHARINSGGSLRDAVETALPLAAANAARPGVADFPLPIRQLGSIT